MSYVQATKDLLRQAYLYGYFHVISASPSSKRKMFALEFLVIDKRNWPNDNAKVQHVLRSEEHTSELQSLMRISYAVFCLKKKKNNTYNKYMRQSKEETS